MDFRYLLIAILSVGYHRINDPHGITYVNELPEVVAYVSTEIHCEHLAAVLNADNEQHPTPILRYVCQQRGQP